MERGRSNDTIMFTGPLGGAPAPRFPVRPRHHDIGKTPVTNKLNLVFPTSRAFFPATNGGAPCAF